MGRSMIICIFMIVVLITMMNLRFCVIGTKIPACKSLVERSNTTTGPPSSQDILEGDEQGIMFPADQYHMHNESLLSRAPRRALLQQSSVPSVYVDGSGTYITSDEVHHYASGVKCWSDYFVVESGYSWNPWVKASGDLYCSGTSSCTFSHMDGYETCQTWSISISTGVQNEFINFGISAGYEHQDCKTGSDTSECTWSDGQCHCIWTQQQMSYQKGYKRRRCSSDQGDYTAWMEDIVHDAPTSVVNYGCGSQCTDT